jgi:hypothetical protein
MEYKKTGCYDLRLVKIKNWAGRGPKGFKILGPKTLRGIE